MPFNLESRHLSSTRIPGKQNRRLEEDVVYKVPGERLWIMAESGFTTDFGSIPDFAKPLVSNDDNRVIRPSIIHDWIYRNDGHLLGFKYKGHLQIARRLPRSKADKIFYQGLREEGVSWFKANLMYLAVRVGGWMFWGGE